MINPVRTVRSWMPGVARCASLLVSVVGAVSFLSWVLRRNFVLHGIPGRFQMNPTAAVCFVLLGAALCQVASLSTCDFPRRRLVGRVLAGLVAVVGFLKILEYAFGLDLDVDQRLFEKLVRAADPPNQLAPMTALNLLLCGWALLWFDWEAPTGFKPGQVFILVVGLITLLALIGYSYQVPSLYRWGTTIPMAFETALAFALFVMAYLAARPAAGLMNVVTSPSTGGAIARRLVPMAIIIPWVLGGLLLWGEKTGFYEPRFGVSIFAVLCIVIFSGFIWLNARLLHLADLERTRTDQRLAAQHMATRVLTESLTVEEALPRILKGVVEALDWEAGLFWAVRGDQQALRCEAEWHRPESPSLVGFAELCRHQELPISQSLASRVWTTLRPVWISDLRSEPGFVETAAAAETGLRGTLVFPIQVDHQCFGVMQVFSRRVERPDIILTEMLAGFGNQLGQFITRRRAEDQLREASLNLQRSNTELQQFAYVASHDLFEPLRMVISYLQLLVERNKSKLDDLSQEFIGYAIDGARRMEALIKDLLAYSRVDMRGGQFEPLDCEQALRAALSNLKVALEERGAVVTHEPLPRIKGDKVQIIQVFQNLIGNGIKFHGADEPPKIHISCHKSGAEWIIGVQDNGIGIPVKDFERIFVIFQRLHTRQEYKGTGMGLAICKKIIERHGGRIWLESTVGKGSTFFFSLPMLKEPGT